MIIVNKNKLEKMYLETLTKRNLLPFTDEWNRNALGEQAGIYLRKIERLKSYRS